MNEMERSGSKGVYSGNLNTEHQGLKTGKTSAEKLQEFDKVTKKAKVTSKDNQKIYDFSNKKISDEFKNNLKDLGIKGQTMDNGKIFRVVIENDDFKKIHDLTKDTIAIKKNEGFGTKAVIDDYKPSPTQLPQQKFHSQYMNKLEEKMIALSKNIDSSIEEKPIDEYKLHKEAIQKLLNENKSVDGFQKAIMEAGTKGQISYKLAEQALVVSEQLRRDISKPHLKV